MWVLGLLLIGQLKEWTGIEGERERKGMTCNKGPHGGIKSEELQRGHTDTASVYWVPALETEPPGSPINHNIMNKGLLLPPSYMPFYITAENVPYCDIYVARI